MFDRLIRLIGQDGFLNLQKKRVLLVGVGGVGGYVLESLVRSGILHITICDFDRFEETNINRQILATSVNLGNLKVEEASLRARIINPNCQITANSKKIEAQNISRLEVSSFDYVIDACDDINVKVALILECRKKMVPIISCMGTGNRIYPECLEIGKLKDTQNDPLARKLRSTLRKIDPESLNVMVVYSRELPLKTEFLGTVCSVPMVAGALLSSYVINLWLEEKKSFE